MLDPYIYTGADPSDPDGDGFTVSMDALTVAVVNPGPLDGEWTITSRAPLAFGTVSFQSDDRGEAESNATGWIENHVQTERPDLLEDD